MSGYVELKRTKQKEVDEILEMIERAGDGFHHTSEWIENYDFLGGKSYIDLINEKIQDASRKLIDPPLKIRELSMKSFIVGNTFSQGYCIGASYQETLENAVINLAKDIEARDDLLMKYANRYGGLDDDQFKQKA